VKRHQLDLFSLIAGLTFVTIAVLYLLDASGQLSVNGRLVIPLLLIALGVGGLAAAIQRLARGQRAAEAPQAPEPEQSASGFDDYEGLKALGLLDDEPTGPTERR
jgi:hypothetical protein